MDRKNLIFYTDGSCSGNPGPGGYGVICLDESEQVVRYMYSQRAPATTNNRMELSAILHTLELASQHPEYNFIIYSDSSYAINCVNLWIHNWANNQWQNSKKKTVENLDLVKEIYKYIAFPLPNYTLSKVKGHKGLFGNEVVDRLAKGDNKEFLNLLKDYSFESILSSIENK